MLHIRDMLKVATPLSVRRQIKKAQFNVRMPTSSLRVLPDFLIIGTMRGGTSSLFKYLGAHPGVISSLRKEVNFFTRWYDQGEQWYRRHFPTRLHLRASEAIWGRNIVTFEATPDYLFYPYAAERAASLVPNAKIIVLLRNPVDRAFSDYRHMVRLGFESLTFEEAIDQESARLRSERSRILTDPTYYSKEFFRYSYFSRGLYADQLVLWLKYFPLENFLFLRSEDFFVCPGAVYGELLDFLHLAPWEPPKFRNYSYLGTKKAKVVPSSTLPDVVRQDMMTRYAAHNQRLFELLGRDFDW